MSEYLFYNTEGFTQGPNVNDIEISAIYQIISINFMAKTINSRFDAPRFLSFIKDKNKILSDFYPL